jgi:hypothetical protein
MGSGSKKLGLMPDPSPRLSTGISYSWTKNKFSLPQKDTSQLSGYNIRQSYYLNVALTVPERHQTVLRVLQSYNLNVALTVPERHQSALGVKQSYHLNVALTVPERHQPALGV